MDVARVRPVGSRGHRLAAYVCKAAATLGWRHLAMAALASFLFAVFNPGGGTLRLFVPAGQPIIPELHIDLVFFGPLGLALVFAAMVADCAVDDGIRPFTAYLAATLFAAVAWPVAGLGTAHWAGWWQSSPLLYVFWIFTVLIQCGAGVSIYAYMRQTKRALERLQASEAQRARDAQHVSEARLLALQSRVDPDLLFETLSLVLRRHASDPHGAETLLEGLISLLHLLLPAAGRASASVEHELELSAAHAHVLAGSAALQGMASPQLHAHASAEAARARLAPLIVLPLVRHALVLSAGDVSLQATVEGQRLRVTLAWPVASAESQTRLRAEIHALRHEVERIYGGHGTLSLDPAGERHTTTRLILEVPFEHDDRADR